MEQEGQALDIKKQILDEIKKADTVIIHRHVHPDPDAIGSQCGLAELITSSYPDKKVKTTGEMPDSLTFLAEMDVPSDEE